MIAVCIQETFFTWNTRVCAFATSCLHANTFLPKITLKFIGTSSSPYTSNINLAILQGNLHTKSSWPVNPYLLQRSCFRHPRKLNTHQNVRNAQTQVNATWKLWWIKGNKARKQKQTNNTPNKTSLNNTTMEHTGPRTILQSFPALIGVQRWAIRKIQCNAIKSRAEHSNACACNEKSVLLLWNIFTASGC